MRWFVEVSHVGDDVEKLKYCVDASQWQAALQETRKLRGDSGALSRFSIELLDNGYRAVDPKAKVRYVVHKAPPDAPVTGDKPEKLAADAPVTSGPATVPPTSRSSAAPPPRSAAPLPKTARDAGAQKSYPVPDHLTGGTPPTFQLLRKRKQEPTDRSPIAYREYAYATPADTTPAAAELLAWTRFREIAEELAQRPPGKFVQLAVFDHEFDARPLRPPLVTLAWKDWRGAPVVQFPGKKPSASGSASAAPSPASASPSAAPSSGPSETIPAPEPPKPGAAKAAAEAKTADDPAAGADGPVVEVRTQSGAFVGPGNVPPQQPLSEAPGAPVEEPVDEPTEQPSPAPAAAARRKKPNEDLIGDLFETMHQLHFVSDVVSGTEFVLDVVKKTLPSAAVVIHVFDIDNGKFVVVRAHGNKLDDVLMQTTSGDDGFFASALRRTRCTRVDDASGNDRYQDGIWKRLDVQPESALCGPVALGGRYLGIIEVANPEGGGPYYESESNALDYICEQYAEFLAQRPIVVDAEVVLGSS